MSNSMLSIVDYKDDGKLCVRARKKGDIERVFPGVKVTQSKNRDYRYRAFIPRAQVAQAIKHQIFNINYPNFKASASEDRSDAYDSVWATMASWQHLQDK